MKTIINKENLEYKPIRRKSVKWGIIGSLSLFSVYFIILSIANSFEHAVSQFIEMWYWVSLLVVGFGIQLGLYVYIRNMMRNRKIIGVTTEIAASGGVSTGAMIACCAHHLTDVLPIIGLSAAALFLNQFQTLFIVIGVLSNLIGVNIMLKIIQENRLYIKSGILSEILKMDMKKMMYYTIPSSTIIFLTTLYISLG